ncbi:hypothetical protein [Dysgonomonas sp. 25]|uniref:hypothetical protein n=1 Tax=Dysgonomonas sp. 25 TaxID=2302933 RepID=UPI0013D259CF|nr:hypothetical protein [Dysgonomonas sp. 25]
MKALYILFILTMSAFSCISSQERKEIEINNSIYYLTASPAKLYSSKNVLQAQDSRSKCPYIEIEQYEENPFSDLVKRVFTKDRIKELAQNNKGFGLVLICNQDGLVKEVTYLFYSTTVTLNGDNNSISYNEIGLFEKEIKRYKFRLSNTCEDVKYYTISMPCQFKKYLN